MQKFAEGSERAFTELYGRYSSALLRFMSKMLNYNESLAQDLLHEVFLVIIEQPERFDTSRNFKSWVYTVAANRCKKHYREKKTDDLESLLDSTNTPNIVLTDQLDQRAFKKDLRKELAQLSYEHRCTFILRYQERLSVKDIATIMDCSEGTVKSRTHYCLKSLSTSLAVYNPQKTN